MWVPRRFVLRRRGLRRGALQRGRARGAAGGRRARIARWRQSDSGCRAAGRRDRARPRSGGGIDVILSAKRVGPTGTAYGLDMTDEMLTLARRNVSESGVTNVHFLKGMIEDIPLPAASVDVVISNCVINLSV